MQERLRVVPRPPKGASITVAQAKRAFLKVEREGASKRVSRSAKTGRVIEKESTPRNGSAEARGLLQQRDPR